MKPAMDTVGNLAYVVVAIMGAAFAAQGRITVGDIQAFIQYVKNFTQPITQLAQVSNILQQTAAAAERVFEFLEASEEEPETPRAHAADVDTDMEFDHVRFGYDAAHPVIHDFTAHVAPGQTVALVGPTGAGKTTMVKLIMRFYDVDAGAIRMGGHDLREFSRADVRSQFGMVLQDTWLFNGTVRENIRFGDLAATDEEVEQAARRAHAHHFIETLPGGYDCVIGEDASNLSLGERQLLTIARAFLANRRMLILDEATSSVDTRTEKLIQQAMDELMVGRTAFVIAHRLSTIKNADLILVINDGDIIEQGTHDELLAQNGAYADLYRAQFSDAGRASASD
jgi:ATP-binding cassette subfamily B protein